MSYVNDKLTTEERQRNSHGPMLAYMYTARNNGPYPAPCYFSEVPKNHTEVKAMMYTDILVPKEKLIKGAYPGAHMDTYYPGFPTMKHLKYKVSKDGGIWARETFNDRGKIFSANVPGQRPNFFFDVCFLNVLFFKLS